MPRAKYRQRKVIGKISVHLRSNTWNSWARWQLGRLSNNRREFASAWRTSYLRAFAHIRYFTRYSGWADRMSTWDSTWNAISWNYITWSAQPAIIKKNKMYGKIFSFRAWLRNEKLEEDIQDLEDSLAKGRKNNTLEEYLLYLSAYQESAPKNYRILYITQVQIHFSKWMLKTSLQHASDKTVQVILNMPGVAREHVQDASITHTLIVVGAEGITNRSTWGSMSPMENKLWTALRKKAQDRRNGVVLCKINEYFYFSDLPFFPPIEILPGGGVKACPCVTRYTTETHSQLIIWFWQQDRNRRTTVCTIRKKLQPTFDVRGAGRNRPDSNHWIFKVWWQKATRGTPTAHSCRSYKRI